MAGVQFMSLLFLNTSHTKVCRNPYATQKAGYPVNEIEVHFAALCVRPNNSFKPTPHRGVGHVPTLR